MRMVLLNPHVDDFMAMPLHFWLLGRKGLKKYKFLIAQNIQHGGTCYAYLDFRASSFIPVSTFLLLPVLMRKWIARVEFWLWAKVGGFSEKIVCLSPDQIGVADVLVGFSYKSARGIFENKDSPLGCFGSVIFHLSHYFAYTRDKSMYLSQVPNVWLAGDSDISDNAYFRKHFGWYNKKFLVMPFSVTSRFFNKNLLRINRCVATGSFHDLSKEVPRAAYEEYIFFSRIMTHHPFRSALFDKNKGEISGIVECLVRPYRDYGRNNGGLRKFIQHFLIAQNDYFSFDIVDVYNRYRFAVVGEEYSGFPGLGAFEAMTCGAILIGYPPAYMGYGLIPGVHFLPYDGTLPGLLDTLKIAEEEDLRGVAESGHKFAINEFSEEAVFKKWWQAAEYTTR